MQSFRSMCQEVAVLVHRAPLHQRISQTEINNSSGVITALNGSSLGLFNGATVSGGTITTAGTGVVEVFPQRHSAAGAEHLLAAASHGSTGGRCRR